MNENDLEKYIMSKPEAVKEHPNDDEVKAFKVCNKIFGLLAYDEGLARINLKCDPDLALELREKYEAVVPGYQMNKKHWNTIFLDGSVPEDLLLKLVDDSFALVVNTLPTVKRNLVGFD